MSTGAHNSLKQGIALAEVRWQPGWWSRSSSSSQGWLSTRSSAPAGLWTTDFSWRQRQSSRWHSS
jgi:hypothetical protein